MTMSERISKITVGSRATLGIHQSINRTLHVGLEFGKTHPVPGGRCTTTRVSSPLRTQREIQNTSHTQLESPGHAP
jgi:hypothetical protein